MSELAVAAVTRSLSDFYTCGFVLVGLNVTNNKFVKLYIVISNYAKL